MSLSVKVPSGGVSNRSLSKTKGEISRDRSRRVRAFEVKVWCDRVLLEDDSSYTCERAIVPAFFCVIPKAQRWKISGFGSRASHANTSILDGE